VAQDSVLEGSGRRIDANHGDFRLPAILKQEPLHVAAEIAGTISKNVHVSRLGFRSPYRDCVAIPRILPVQHGEQPLTGLEARCAFNGGIGHVTKPVDKEVDLIATTGIHVRMGEDLESVGRSLASGPGEDGGGIGFVYGETEPTQVVFIGWPAGGEKAIQEWGKEYFRLIDCSDLGERGQRVKAGSAPGIQGTFGVDEEVV
jgi:hypothetical protein